MDCPFSAVALCGSSRRGSLVSALRVWLVFTFRSALAGAGGSAPGERRSWSSEARLLGVGCCCGVRMVPKLVAAPHQNPLVGWEYMRAPLSS